MNDKINFNVIEKNKTDNTKEIQNAINIIMNKLIAKQFVNLQHYLIDKSYSILYNNYGTNLSSYTKRRYNYESCNIHKTFS